MTVLAPANPVTARFPAFGGTATVAVADGAELDAALEAVHHTVDAFDRACSRFRPDSELEAVNRAGGAEVAIGPVLRDALRAALLAAEVTGGAVDPTIGASLIALGYDRDLDAVRAAEPVTVRAERVPGWRSVALDATAGTVRIPAGASLDLGATAKALAADVAADAASRAAGCGVLVSFSGDLALAGQAPAGGWAVRVTDDHRSGPEVPGQTVLLHHGGLATSSHCTRTWDTAAGPQHHLLDPATGLPAAAPWRTVSVLAATCLEANIATTALMVSGTPALDLLTDGPLPARLVSDDGTVEHRHGWPSAGEEQRAGAVR